MAILQRLFGGIDCRYLVRAYFISAALLAYALWYSWNIDAPSEGERALLIGYFILAGILFPFAKLAWDELRHLLLGDTVLLVDGWAFLVNLTIKAMVNTVLWFSTPLIAPLGLLYLWLRTR